ncbi:DUF5020 family protein [Candidatus Sulfidibacterium hydrothermale]|uniref:DUF5020 family protein n=1 Tax=Candidatus Sulfidibacterium hydrothermale TaxID=2875962 RepID=UPI001F0A101D|nr:DUF5020 family protein [Candidatus Sulfidibacterium hydrothermale]UBM62230.1 DUF5020 family protein [Candidatus Sulfidibacterium hydrothermale]
MKRFFLLFLGFVLSLTTFAQTDIQLHWVFGAKDQQAHLLSTVESFNVDKWGSTYFFIDMNYKVSDNLYGVNTSYWEISRNLRFWKPPIDFHVEYNGGFGMYEATPYNGAYEIKNAWLFGGQYTWASKDFNKIFILELLYKYIVREDYPSFQITGVWKLNFFKKKLTVSGFFDFWHENKDYTHSDGTTNHTNMVFLSQPQFWYNFGQHFSMGSEIDLENNFIIENFRIVATAAVKWTF